MRSETRVTGRAWARAQDRALRAVLTVLVAAGGRAARAQVARGDTAVARPGIERLGAVVQQRLQLRDDQTARLRETARRYAAQRKAMLREERDARRTVRDEVARGDAADQARVQAGLDRLYEMQQRRTELAAREQRDLATFLSPTQRAQYAGMQERAFRAAQEIRQRREAGALPPAGARAAAHAELRDRRAEQEQLRRERQAERQARRAARRAQPHER